ncbi:hypothetical protein QQ045_013158 [Rhodiola kirilowii]
MADVPSSSMIVPSESVLPNRAQMTNSNPQPFVVPQCSSPPQGHVAILWDMENCHVPSDVRPEDVGGNIRMALRVHPMIQGVVTMFSAYGDFNGFPRRLREGCQRTGVKLIDVPNGRKDAADKAILVDMFLFALDNPPPSTIMLISGDVDFAPALHILGQRGYIIVLVIPSNVGVSSALSNAGRFVWDWQSVVRGEGLLPHPRAIYPPRVGPAEVAGYLVGYHDDLDGQANEESIVYRGIKQGCYSTHGSLMTPQPIIDCTFAPSVSHSIRSDDARDTEDHILPVISCGPQTRRGAHSAPAPTPPVEQNAPQPSVQPAPTSVVQQIIDDGGNNVEFSSLSKAVNKALAIEDIQIQIRAAHEQKKRPLENANSEGECDRRGKFRGDRPPISQGGGHHPQVSHRSDKVTFQGSRQTHRGSRGNQRASSQTRVPCKSCGRAHGGVCFKEIGACFSCGQHGHYMSQCPTRGGSLQHMTARPASSYASVMRPLGQPHISGGQYVVYVPAVQPQSEGVGQTPNQLMGHGMFTDIILLDMLDFDIILGDWLSTYRCDS